MSTTIYYPLNRPDTNKNVGARPIFYSPLSVTLPAKIRFLSLTEARFSKGRNLEWKWLKDAALVFAVAGVLVAGALVYAGRQAQSATTYSAMAELAGTRVISPADTELTVAAIGRAAEQDVAIRRQRLDNLLQAQDLSGWRRVASSVSQYMSYGPMCRQEALALERQQLAMAQDALDRYETASVRHATRGTRDLAQN